MRALAPFALLVALLLLVPYGTNAVLAEEPPAPKEEPSPPTPEEATPETDETEPPEETVLEPRKAYVEATQAAMELPRAQQMPARRKAAQDWLARWETSGQTADGMSLLYLGRLQQMAERYVDAAASFRALLATEETPETLRAQAATGVAGLLSNAKSRKPLTAASQCVACVESVTAYLTTASGQATANLRANTHRTLGNYFSVVNDGDASISHHMRAAVLNPSLATASARSVLREMMGRTHSMEGYAPLRAGANAVLAALGALAQQNLEQARQNLATLEKDGAADARIRSAERALRSAERGADLQARYAKPFAMMGTDAPQWTLEHAFGDLKALSELKGKVVVLDFWATWCPWCIKSFPAIRDVLRDYEGKDLVFVGVTASASVVYEARYDLDDDLADRHEPGERARAVARLARGNREPDPEKGIFAEAEFKERELAAIQTFIENHEMTWPVVMIDKAEPAPKYALMGWPHAVVIDKQGRIRYFKSGALLREKPEAVKKFRKVLDDLLAE
ncbi:MAG: TlpA family protein disulfide reductase [Planctomycetota bacterium]|nr:TlpA family protein disulfide reductase [Planctomycetota bacterium]